MGSDELVAILKEDYERAKRELDAIKDDVRHSGPRHIEFALDQLWRTIEALTAQLAKARESERAAVVAYLRSEPTKNWTWKALAQSIEAGDHLT